MNKKNQIETVETLVEIGNLINENQESHDFEKIVERIKDYKQRMDFLKERIENISKNWKKETNSKKKNKLKMRFDRHATAYRKMGEERGDFIKKMLQSAGEKKEVLNLLKGDL